MGHRLICKGFQSLPQSLRDNEPNVAVSLANYRTHVFTLGNTGLAELTTLEEHTKTIVGVKFVPGDRNLLYTGSIDGSIRLWDVRTPKKSVGLFTDTTVEPEKEQKVFTCFDVSPNNRVLCTGTEVFETDAFILFWEVRNFKLLGGYWESHTDDITQLKFHHTNPDRLISGSTDGLINLYDLSQATEEDAFIDCLNTESSVEKLEWFDNKGKDGISCTTHTAEVQLWNIEGVQPEIHFRREDIAKAMKAILGGLELNPLDFLPTPMVGETSNSFSCKDHGRIAQKRSLNIVNNGCESLEVSKIYYTSYRKETGDFIYVVNTHETDQGLFLLAGSNAHQGQCFRGFKVKKDPIPAVGFSQNKQRVRTSFHNKNTGLLLTGGEMGILNTCMLNLKNS